MKNLGTAFLALLFTSAAFSAPPECGESFKAEKEMTVYQRPKTAKTPTHIAPGTEMCAGKRQRGEWVKIYSKKDPKLSGYLKATDEQLPKEWAKKHFRVTPIVPRATAPAVAPTRPTEPFGIPAPEPITGPPLEASRLMADNLPLSAQDKFLFSPNGRRAVFVSIEPGKLPRYGVTGGKRWESWKPESDLLWATNSANYQVAPQFPSDQSRHRLNAPVPQVLAQLGSLHVIAGPDPKTIIVTGKTLQPYLGTVRVREFGNIDFKSVRFNEKGNLLMFGSLQKRFKPGAPSVGELWWNVIDVPHAELKREKDAFEKLKGKSK